MGLRAGDTGAAGYFWPLKHKKQPRYANLGDRYKVVT